jgi:Beta-lactamase enzyme family
MKRTLLTCALLVVSVTPACSRANTAQKNSNAAKPAEAQAAKRDESRRELEEQFAKIAAEAKGRVGVAARVLETGEEANLAAGEHYVMHSVYKLPISLAVLRRVDEGKLKLDQKVKVEPKDFVREGMYSPIRDKNPKGVHQRRQPGEGDRARLADAVRELGDARRRGRTARGVAGAARAIGRQSVARVQAADGIDPRRESPERATARRYGRRAQDRHGRPARRRNVRDERHRHHHAPERPTRRRRSLHHRLEGGLGYARGRHSEDREGRLGQVGQ